VGPVGLGEAIPPHAAATDKKPLMAATRSACVALVF
jgi:hypothetical protein